MVSNHVLHSCAKNNALRRLLSLLDYVAGITSRNFGMCDDAAIEQFSEAVVIVFVSNCKAESFTHLYRRAARRVEAPKYSQDVPNKVT
jgi:hypothetical protein